MDLLSTIFVVIVILKLSGLVDWSWGMVLTPMWLSLLWEYLNDRPKPG